MNNRQENLGLVHLYTGAGKGKTTAAMGLCLRALGQGKQVVVLQFLKSTPTGEIPLLEGLGATVFRPMESEKFVFQMTPEERADTRSRHDVGLQAALQRPCDLLLLDEACAALQLDMVDEDLLRQAVLNRPQGREVVVTGRGPAPWLLEAAHYHTEMVCHRHPYEECGTPARQGIEF